MKHLREIYDYRQMIFSLVRKELRGRYKGSALGFLWTFINPLLQLCVYTFVFSIVMPNNIDLSLIHIQMCIRDRWKYNADECTRLGIPFGVYIYSYALNTDEARSEAEHVLRLVEGYDLSLPVYLDLEDERYTGRLSNKEIADIAEVFCETIQSAGYEVGIYANLDWFRNRLTDWRFGQWTRWVAQYNYECNYEKNYSMWQCTSTGFVDGIDGPVDLNFTMNITPREPEEGPDPREQQAVSYTHLPF